MRDYTPTAWDLFSRVGLRPGANGSLDLRELRLHLDPADPLCPRLMCDGNVTAISMLELSYVEAHLPQVTQCEDGTLTRIIFADNRWTAVHWKSLGGPCMFRDLPIDVVDVLRAFADTELSASDRRDAMISGADTVLQISEIWHCHGPHAQACPRAGPWAHSVVTAQGAIEVARLALLRGRPVG